MASPAADDQSAPAPAPAAAPAPAPAPVAAAVVPSPPTSAPAAAPAPDTSAPQAQQIPPVASAPGDASAPVSGATVAPGAPQPGGPPAGPDAPGATPTNPNASASLYVGDLHPEVTEQNLAEVFGAVGPVQSVRVCRDVVTRRSLGYGYVNFFSVVDAERALDTMNHYSAPATRGKPLRMMWKHRDPSVRKIGQGNIFIKNLDESIDNKSLYDTFSAFGNIMSCKVKTDEHGKSLGYGFVHFETAESASTAMEKVNGMLLAGAKVYVGPFQSKRERESSGAVTKTFTNVYVKNLSEDYSGEEKLRELFGAFGAITSVHVPDPAAASGDDKVATGFGFVNFDEPSSAAKAVDELNGKDIDGKTLYVGRAQKKAEREQELKSKAEQWKAERNKQYQHANLYVKNLGDEVDDEGLKELFAPFGTITSSKIMLDERGESKGVAFVCFSASEEATKAVTDLNGRIFNSKPIYVALHQRKEDRRLTLEAHRSQMRLPPNVGPMYVQAGSQLFFGQVPPGMPQGPVGRGVQPSYGGSPFMGGPVARNGPGPVPVGRGSQMGPAIPMGRGYPVPQPGMPGPVQYAPPQGPNRQPRQPRGRGGQPIVPGVMPMQGRAAGVPVPQGGGRGRGGPPGGQQYKQYGARATGQPGGTGATQNEQSEPAGEGNLTLEMLSSTNEAGQKQMLGEKLYPLVQEKQPAQAPKVTGMLLEMDNSEIVHMLDTPEALNERIEEAVLALRNLETGNDSAE